MHAQTLNCIALVALMGLCAAPATAAEEFRYKLGVSKVTPRSKATDFQGSFTPPGLSLKLQPFTALTFSVMRDWNERVELEFAAGIPPTANVSAVVRNTGLPAETQALNGQTAAFLKLVSPAFYVNYKFGRPKARWQPYVGLGLNYVVPKGTSTPVNEALNLGPTEIIASSGFGAAAQAGVNYWFSEDVALTANLAMWRNRSKITFITTTLTEPVDVRLSRSAVVTTQPLLFSLSISGRF